MTWNWDIYTQEHSSGCETRTPRTGKSPFCCTKFCTVFLLSSGIFSPLSKFLLTGCRWQTPFWNLWFFYVLRQESELKSSEKLSHESSWTYLYHSWKKNVVHPKWLGGKLSVTIYRLWNHSRLSSYTSRTGRNRNLPVSSDSKESSVQRPEISFAQQEQSYCVTLHPERIWIWTVRSSALSRVRSLPGKIINSFSQRIMRSMQIKANSSGVNHLACHRAKLSFGS